MIHDRDVSTRECQDVNIPNIWKAKQSCYFFVCCENNHLGKSSEVPDSLVKYDCLVNQKKQDLIGWILISYRNTHNLSDWKSTGVSQSVSFATIA